MQQTLLALGALLILVTLTLNQKRSVFLVQKNAFHRELEAASADFAQKRLHEIVSGLAFDDQRVGITSLNTSTSDLTAIADLGADAGDLDDIDDLHNTVDTTLHELNKEAFRIRANYSVRYVLPNGNPAPSPTLAKEITVEAETLDSIGEARGKVRFQKIVVISDFVH